MRLEGAGAPKRERPGLTKALLGVVIAVAIIVPAVLYYTRGRKVPLRVALDADRFIAGIGERVALTLRYEPPKTPDVTLSLSGDGVSKTGATTGQFVAPTKIGLHTITLTGHVSGTKVTDKISIRVVPRALAKYRPLRPVASAPASQPAASQPTSAPAAPTAKCDRDKVVVHGTPCAGCVVVAELVPAAKMRATVHRLEGVADSARRGRVATLRIPRDAKVGVPLVFATEIWRDGGRCVQQRKLPVLPAPPLVADFRWQVIAPGYFRFAARPPRSGNVAAARYTWKLDDGSAPRTLAKPRHSHRFAGKRRRYHIVTLTIARDGASASATRVVIDRTVAR